MSSNILDKYDKFFSVEVWNNGDPYYYTLSSFLSGKKVYTDWTDPLFKFIPYNDVKTQTVTHKTDSNVTYKNPFGENNFVVKLGGTFLKIGDEDEAIGGDAQKVGTGN